MSFDKKTAIQHARELRKEMTMAEKLLWCQLRCRRLNGYRFRRQVPLGKYIVDFMCKESKLIIELDGGQHNEIRAARYDQERTVWIEANGYFVQRFWNSEVLDQCNAVLEVIQELCVKRKPSIMTFPHNKRGEGMR